jgi:thiol-disulfide isomerase/thioredoxin
MKKLIHPEKVNRIVRFLRPWLVALAMVLVLRYTGLLSGITDVTGRAMLQTGAMDFEPASLPGAGERAETFDYNFTVKDLEGKQVDFNQFKGKVVFLNLWATWCGPCRAEMPSIHNLYNAVKGNDKIVFVMLSLDRDDQQGKVVSYVADKSFTFPVYMTSGGVNAQLEQVSSIPTTFVLTPDGKIASKRVGTANYDTDKFKAFLQELSTAGGEAK